MLKIDSIETSYGSSQVLFGLSLEVQEGQVVTLMGRNGMGKTTTVRSIMGQAPAHGGSITFDGVELTKMEDYMIAQLGLGLVPEGRQVFPNLTVRENLVATAENRSGSSDPWTLDKVLDLLPRLAERRDAMGNQLSGGEQQMVAIGRALMTNPKMLILDEATSNLDTESERLIQRSLTMLMRQRTSFVIAHRLSTIQRADMILVIEDGEIVERGKHDELIAREGRYHQLYTVQARI